MFDEFRQQAEESFFDEFDEDDGSASHNELLHPREHFLGMTPFQRFFIALMLLAITCLISTLCLLVTQRIIPPFFQ